MAEQTRGELCWIERMRFSGRTGSGHEIVLDSPAQPDHAGPSPMEHLLLGVAGCTAMDVVAILQKMREPISGLTVSVVGDRAPKSPKYFTAMEITYRIRGRGLNPEKVQRAVDLSHSTYCSASASLREDCVITSRIELLDED